MESCCIHHVFCRDLYLQRVRQQVEDERHIDITEVNEVLYLLFVYEVDVVYHLIAVEPGVVKLIACNLKRQEERLAPVAHACRVQVKGVQLVEEQRGVVETLLCERVVLEVVAREKGLHVVVLCRLAVVHFVVDVLRELKHSRMNMDVRSVLH